MAQPEETGNIEEFSRFQAARAMARIETDLGYDLSPGMIIASSGTAIVPEQIELETDPIKIVIVDSIASPAGNTMLGARIGEIAELTSELQAVIDHARSQGLQEIADRFVELGQQPLEEDEVPLQAASAMFFVEYCIARQKQGRPLMTPTPTGELDATWKGSEGESVTMRFFPNGSVWVAYKLLKEKGSFEASATDLVDSRLRFIIPDWA